LRVRLLAAQLVDCRTNVVAHQVQLVVGAPSVGWAASSAGGSEKDQATITGVDRREIEHVAEEHQVGLCIAVKMIA
jgi:hypothetical protein